MLVPEVQFKNINKTHELFVLNHWFLELIKLHLAESTSCTLWLLPMSSLLCSATLAFLQQLRQTQLSPSQALCTHCCSMPRGLYPGPWLAHAHPWGLSFIVPAQGDVPDTQSSVRVFYFPSHCTSHNLKLHVCLFAWLLLSWVKTMFVKFTAAPVPSTASDTGSKGQEQCWRSEEDFGKPENKVFSCHLQSWHHILPPCEHHSPISHDVARTSKLLYDYFDSKHSRFSPEFREQSASK